MKKFFTVLLLIPALSFSQTGSKEITEADVAKMYASLPKVDGQYEFTEVVKLDSSYSQAALYRNAKLFFAETFKSAKDVLQYDDKEEGKVIGKGNLKLSEVQGAFLVVFSETRYVNFTVEIFCKDGRYKYRIHDVNSDYSMRASGGSSPDNVSNGSLTLDQAYDMCNKGSTKKMNRKLFYETVSNLELTAAEIKSYMSKKASSSDF